MVLTIGDGPAIRRGMDPAPIPSLSARPSRPRLSDRRRENPLRTLRNATTARYTDASDASEDVSARVVCASVCVCFCMVWMRAIVSFEGRKERMVDGAEAVEGVDRVEEVVGVVGGTKVRERAGD